MGLETNRFVSEATEEFICAVCQAVYQDPVRLELDCDHHFCRICINTWLDERHTCPVDNLYATKSHIKPLARTMKNLYDRLKLKCSFADRGCTIIAAIPNMETHESECEHNPNPTRLYSCPECDGQITVREQLNHNCICYWKSMAQAFMLERDEMKQNCDRLQREVDEFKRARGHSSHDTFRRAPILGRRRASVDANIDHNYSGPTRMSHDDDETDSDDDENFENLDESHDTYETGSSNATYDHFINLTTSGQEIADSDPSFGHDDEDFEELSIADEDEEEGDHVISDADAENDYGDLDDTAQDETGEFHDVDSQSDEGETDEEHIDVEVSGNYSDADAYSEDDEDDSTAHNNTATTVQIHDQSGSSDNRDDTTRETTETGSEDFDSSSSRDGHECHDITDVRVEDEDEEEEEEEEGEEEEDEDGHEGDEDEYEVNEDNDVDAVSGEEVEEEEEEEDTDDEDDTPESADYDHDY